MQNLMELLRKSMDEIREYQRQNKDDELWDAEWYDNLIQRLEVMTHLTDVGAIGWHMESILHSLADSGPLSSELSPSLYALADALDRWQKKWKDSQRNA